MANFSQFNRQFTPQVRRAIRDAFSKQYFTQIGKQVRDQIRIRTRSGFSVRSNGARQQRLRPLSRGYVATRQFARKVGLLSSATSPGTSNLTFTGNMLDSIAYKASNSGVILGFSNRRAIETADEVQSKGRPFFNLSSSETRGLTRQFNNRLRTFLIRI